ncbi:MAG: 3-dehydroquinate synthase [Prevotella sp.]|nr:3-dehydroquinate synthase [Prevotella sp.]
MSRVIISDAIEKDLSRAITTLAPDRIFILSDETTHRLCVPLISGFASLAGAKEIVIPAGDTHKTLDSVVRVWAELQSGKASRKSLLVNCGGGMVTDLGGFAASCFKRGIAFINIPTTLLAMVDASVGGKTGINFGMLKNEIGVFNEPYCVILDTSFLRTLDDVNIRSGYAEMLKHGLLSNSTALDALLRFDLARPDLSSLAQMLAGSVAVKERIVEQDPTEKGIRKALNVGHTVGHAIESLALRRGSPILHGYAVAYGMIAELYLSRELTGFPVGKMRQVVAFIHEYYGTLPITCNDYDELLELMTHDKKNTAGQINFTLLDSVGGIRINQTVDPVTIREALDACLRQA